MLLITPTVPDAIVRMMATMLSPAVRRSVAFLEEILRDPVACEPVTAYLRPSTAVAVATPRTVELAEDGYPVSSNVVWNKCVRGTATLADMRGNTDRVRIGRHAWAPKTCGSYRTAGTEEWSYPDDPFLTLTILLPTPASGDAPLVRVPQGYVVAPAETAVAAK